MLVLDTSVSSRWRPCHEGVPQRSKNRERNSWRRRGNYININTENGFKSSSHQFSLIFSSIFVIQENGDSGAISEDENDQDDNDYEDDEHAEDEDEDASVELINMDTLEDVEQQGSSSTQQMKPLRSVMKKVRRSASFSGQTPRGEFYQEKCTF